MKVLEKAASCLKMSLEETHCVCSDLFEGLSAACGSDTRAGVPVPPGSPLAASPFCSWCPELLTKVIVLCGNFVGINICLSAALG